MAEECKIFPHSPLDRDSTSGDRALISIDYGKTGIENFPLSSLWKMEGKSVINSGYAYITL